MNLPDDSCNLCRIEMANVNVVRDKHKLLSNINIHIHCGQLTALIGQNGAGKTTLLKTILNEIPYQGQIYHKNFKGETLAKIKVGYVPQNLDFDKDIPVTVEDFLAATITRRPVWMGVSKKTRSKILESLSLVKGEELIDSSLGRLSGGELQRVLLAMAINPQPDILLLDEPVSGIDRNGLTVFLDIVSTLIKQRHMAIMLVSHDLALVKEYADYIILLNKQVLAQGSAKEVFASKAFNNTFGI